MFVRRSDMRRASVARSVGRWGQEKENAVALSAIVIHLSLSLSALPYSLVFNSRANHPRRLLLLLLL